MSVVDTKEFYKRALKSDYAIGGFQAYNMEMIQGIVEAAARMQSPVLVQSSCRGVHYAGADTLFGITEAAAKKWKIPVALHLDHGESEEQCREAIRAGFSSVMLDCTDLPVEEQIVRTKRVVQYAHAHGAVVEGEIALRGEYEEVWMTSPKEAELFARETGCDSLSVCVGNSHALYGRGFPNEKKPYIRLELLKEIHEAIPDVPLVLHSISVGTEELSKKLKKAGGKEAVYGVFSLEELHEAMKLGVVKCNVGTNKIAVTAGVREVLEENRAEIDPRRYFGKGKQVMIEAIKDQMKSLFFE